MAARDDRALRGVAVPHFALSQSVVFLSEEGSFNRILTCTISHTSIHPA